MGLTINMFLQLIFNSVNNLSKKALFLILFLIAGLHSSAQKKHKNPPHIVFVTGDEEYRSEESMPMLAEILQREIGAKVTVLYALDKDGYINPNINDNIPGLELLEKADMMVLFLRWRELPIDQAKFITTFAESGKPMVGFRTSTHSFKYVKDLTQTALNDKWPYDVFGQKWITHHGHFDDGKNPLTEVTLMPNKKNKILNGVTPFKAYSWLYHVNGGEHTINPDCMPFMKGRSLKSQHEMDGKLDKYPIEQPVAWTKTYKGTAGKKAKVFFTTLGHPYDFTLEPMRKLAINGILWALGKENKIPKSGANVTLDKPYEPNNSGFGEKFKKNRRP